MQFAIIRSFGRRRILLARRSVYACPLAWRSPLLKLFFLCSARQGGLEPTTLAVPEAIWTLGLVQKLTHVCWHSGLSRRVKCLLRPLRGM